MSKITDKIFKGKEHYVTSKFGKRTPIKTKYGTTSDFHKGTDYGTNVKKIEQYGIEKGVITECSKNSSVGNYVKIKYDRFPNLTFLHYHLDKTCVKTNQRIDENTLLGYTGMTGMSTGIHLHLGIYDNLKGEYIDPEIFALSYTEPIYEPKKSLDEIIIEILDNEKLTGNARIKYCEENGYNSKEVQNEINIVCRISKEILENETRFKLVEHRINQLKSMNK